MTVREQAFALIATKGMRGGCAAQRCNAGQHT